MGCGAAKLLFLLCNTPLVVQSATQHKLFQSWGASLRLAPNTTELASLAQSTINEG